jgi:UDP-N-acetylmuramoylalanine--D-glutamate ligase
VTGFAGIEHAFELVAEVRGIDFVNDSKATNVAAALRGLESLPEPVVLIMGGKSKGGDFTLMRGEIEKKVKNIVLIGEAAPMLRKHFSDLATCTVRESLEEAVRAAFRLAGGKGTVLFAPACASFDMFSDYRERGETFRRAVSELATEEEG